MYFRQIYIFIITVSILLTGCQKLVNDPGNSATDGGTSDEGLNYWGGTYNDEGHALEQTKDGGYIVAGSQFNSTNNEDLYIVKFDSDLNIDNEKIHAGSETTTDVTNAYLTYTSSATDVKQTADGGYITVGNTYNGTDFDVWVVKFLPDLTPHWEAIISTGAGENDWGNSIQEMYSGKFVICGTSYDKTNQDYDIIVWTVEWDGTIATSLAVFSDTNAAGATNTTNDYGHQASQTHDGGLIIVGTQGTDMAVIKLISDGAAGTFSKDTAFSDDTDNSADDGDGHILIDTGNIDEGTYIEQQDDFSYIIAGNTEAGTGHQSNVYVNTISKFGVAGTTPAVLVGEYDDKITCIVQTSDGGFVFTGSKYNGDSHADVWAVKLNASLSVHWNFTYGGHLDDIGEEIAQTFDGGYIITGSTMSYGNQSEIVLLKLKPDGTVDNIIGQLSTSGN